MHEVYIVNLRVCISLTLEAFREHSTRVRCCNPLRVSFIIETAFRIAKISPWERECNHVATRCKSRCYRTWISRTRAHVCRFAKLIAWISCHANVLTSVTPVFVSHYFSINVACHAMPYRFHIYTQLATRIGPNAFSLPIRTHLNATLTLQIPERSYLKL